MKKHNDRPIKDALDELLKSYHLDEQMARVKLMNSWADIMGSSVANRTTELLIRDKTVFISLSSASLRQELFQSKSKVIQLLNEAAGMDIIEEVVFR